MRDDLVKRLRGSTEAMAANCSVGMELWNLHSNACLEAADRIEQLEGLLALYRDAVLIDATMQGPIYRGANSSALKRAWYKDMGEER